MTVPNLDYSIGVRTAASDTGLQYLLHIIRYHFLAFLKLGNFISTDLGRNKEKKGLRQ